MANAVLVVVVVEMGEVSEVVDVWLLLTEVPQSKPLESPNCAENALRN